MKIILFASIASMVAVLPLTAEEGKTPVEKNRIEKPSEETATKPVKPAEAKKEGEAKEKPAEQKEKPTRPRIEVCFVLDTTGSMGGLIEGAKQKIWGIANDIIAAKPTPEVRFGLVGYRDRGDDYVTKRVALTDDLDDVYAKLKEFRAAGGGDGPESVSEALDEAVQKIEWSKDKSVLKIIYLVGDAPPHEYKNGADWRKVCKAAVRADLIINTVQCGSEKETREIWQAIAEKAEGTYLALRQDGNMTVVATPQDRELAELSTKLGRTIVAYGTGTMRGAVAKKQAAADEAAPPVPGTTPAAASAVAERAAYNWKSGKVVQGEGELLDALKAGKVTLDTLKKEELPEALQKLSPEELKAEVEKKQAERTALQGRIAELSKERDAFLEESRKKAAAEKKPDSFDGEVSKTLRRQAEKKGIKYE